MSTVSTESLPFSMAQYTREEIQACLGCSMLEETGTTDPLEFEGKDFAPDVRPHSIWSFMAKAAMAFRTVIPSDRSRPMDSELIMAVRYCKEDQEAVADFFEPVTFNWDHKVYTALEAVRRYSEQTHADY